MRPPRADMGFDHISKIREPDHLEPLHQLLKTRDIQPGLYNKAYNITRFFCNVASIVPIWPLFVL